MKQIVQTVSNGELKIVDVPQPVPSATEVLVATRRSLLSAGTEKAVRELASANLVQKAQARPDLVRQVLSRARRDGIRSTVATVRARLDEEMPLGYSGAGVVVMVGEHVQGIRPGMRVATASAGHAEYQVVPGLLAVPVPDDVSDEAAAFGAVAAIALQGLRQAEVGIGGSICVIGLGLVGQLTVRLALAAGLSVVGIDLREWTADLASRAGANGLVEDGESTTQQIRAWSRGRGVDAVIITAATQSSEPVRRSTALLRDRGRVVVVGDVGLELDRRPFYEGELDVKFARSYGAGRYDRSYEEWGVDYPIGYVRWTERRNIETYLDLVHAGKMVVDDLVTHVYGIQQAHEAYATMESASASLAVQLDYDASATPPPAVTTTSPRATTDNALAGIIGAGSYAKATFLPALMSAGWGGRIAAVTSSKVLNARHLAERYDIASVLPTAQSLIEQDELGIAFILSRHDSHARLTVDALNAGKHVFVEKPLAISQDELVEVREAYQRSTGQLWVGFNRRHSEATKLSKAALASRKGPLHINYRINAGALPSGHWYKDRMQGGRVLGEVCHYVDFANSIAEAAPEAVYAHGDLASESSLVEDVSILLGYGDGTTANISYTTRPWSNTPKEVIEIAGRGVTIVIEDFKKVTVNGRTSSGKLFDKGHANMLRAFASSLQTGDSSGIDQSFSTTEACLRVLSALTNASA